MEILNEQDQEPELSPSTQIADVESGDLLRNSARQGFWAYLSNFLKALCSRKKQVSSQRNIKTAQDWRDEAKTKNPWWGNGI